MAEKLYRIWDKKAQKYYSTGKKSIWKSETWAVAAVKDMWGSTSAKDFEIHIIEQVVTERKEAFTLVQTKKDNEQARKMARNEHGNLVRNIEQLSGLAFHVARMLYGQKRLVESEIEKLKPFMEKIYELEKIM